MEGQGTVGPPAHANGKSSGSSEVKRSRERGDQCGAGQRKPAALQDIFGFLAFREICVVDQVIVPAADRNPHDLKPLPLERQDLPPDKAVADLRILIDQVGYSHGTTYT